MTHHIAFYKFVPLADPHAMAADVDVWTAGLLGTVLLAPEGVNGMLAGDVADLDVFERWLSDVIGPVTFKRTVCDTTPFSRRKVKVKRELVPLRVDEYDAAARVSEIAATSVSPAEWRELIRRDDVVVVDNRNHFEFGVGHFVGAVDPGTTDFRDFRSYVLANADAWRDSGKTVAMYCTGGIRCDKTAPWMSDLGLTVRQLDGGILNYFASMPDAEQDFVGDCFVFDARRAIDTRLNEVPRSDGSRAAD